MKNFKLSFAFFAMLVASCGSECVTEETMVPVSLHVNDFLVSQEDFPVTRANPQTPASYSAMKALTLAFYKDDGMEQYKTTQLREDASTYTTFGDFSLSLPMGSYTMVVAGYGLGPDDEFTLTSPTQAAFSAGCVRETFATTQAVNITSLSAVNLSATLDRVVTKLNVVSTDPKPANASKVRMTFSAGGMSFNPTTGLATVNTGAVSTVSISSATGSTSSSNGYVFLATDEQTMDVTVEVLDADGNTLFSKVAANVPFKRNRVTKLTGTVYSAGATSSFLLNTDWLDEYSVDF